MLRWLLAAIIVLLLGWTIVGSESFHKCEQQRQLPVGDASSVPLMLRKNLDCTAVFLKEYRDELLAVFTIVLAIATIALWAATRDLANDAAKSSKQALRAYVAIHHPKFGKPDPDSITIIIENTGQTPAHEIKARYNCYWMAGQVTGLPDRFAYPDQETTGDFGVYRSVAVLHPKKEAPFVFSLIERVRKNEISLFIYGHVDYEDAFGKDHKTTFCYQYFPASIGIGHSLVMYDEHNQAT